MSEPDVPRNMRLVAVGAALLALVFTLIAVIVVLTRGSGPSTASAKVGAIAFTDHDVLATDVVRLQRNDVELVIAKGATKGLRVKDPALAKALGLEPDDVITSLSGKPMTREEDARDVIVKLSLMNATTLYAEVTRKDKPTLLRWRLDGDLRQARYGSKSSDPWSNPFTPPASPPAYTPPAYTPPSAPDPLLDTITKIDETNYKVPRKTVDAFLADPMSMAKGARVVPAIRNGQPDGFKLYAIRPSSTYARLGFHNGDTIHSINGFELTSADKALEVYTKLRDATSLTFELSRRGKPVELNIEITK
jgi:type II secretory pathway component PulC